MNRLESSAVKTIIGISRGEESRVGIGFFSSITSPKFRFSVTEANRTMIPVDGSKLKYVPSPGGGFAVVLTSQVAGGVAEAGGVKQYLVTKR